MNEIFIILKESKMKKVLKKTHENYCDPNELLFDNENDENSIYLMNLT